QLISIDAGAPLRDRAMSLARALSEIERQTVSMVPEARDDVKAMKGSRPKRGPEELAIISTRAPFIAFTTSRASGTMETEKRIAAEKGSRGISHHLHPRRFPQAALRASSRRGC